VRSARANPKIARSAKSTFGMQIFARHNLVPGYKVRYRQAHPRTGLSDGGTGLAR
jgi:hypothetical protein